MQYVNHGHLEVEIFRYANWLFSRSHADRRLTTGYCSLVGSNLVTKSEEHVTSSHVDEVLNMLIM